MLRKLQEKAGFISIETIIVAGLMISLGAFAITNFYGVGQQTIDAGVANVEKVLDITVGA